VISILNFGVLSRTSIPALEYLQSNDAKIVCYSSNRLASMLRNGGNVLLHLVGDNLQSFGRDQGREVLHISSGGSYESRVIEAFAAVKGSRGWEDPKYHLVISQHDYTTINRAALGLEKEDGCIAKMVVDADANEAWLVNLVRWLKPGSEFEDMMEFVLLNL
jgi:hypothetical protein